MLSRRGAPDGGAADDGSGPGAVSGFVLTGRLPKSGRARPIELSVALPLVREPGVDRLFVIIGNTVEF